MDVSSIISLPNMNPIPGVSAASAARLAAKSSGYDVEDPYKVMPIADEVEKQLKSQGINYDSATVRNLVEQIQKARMTNGGGLVQKANDPVMSVVPYASPADFAGQYPQPLDPTEILTLCEEISTLSF